MDHYYIEDLAQYVKAYRKSVKNPEKFWAKIAARHFEWHRAWHTVLNYDFSKAHFEWFKGASLNITENCLDRHLADKGQKAAILFEPNNPDEPHQVLTFSELHLRVVQMAALLRQKGVGKGDRVCIYLPMIPELAISLLACARIGAVHTVVFAGFSAAALASRIQDSGAKWVITADGSYRGNKTLALKPIVDEALLKCESVGQVMVVKRTGEPVNMQEGRDFWVDACMHDLNLELGAPASVDAEDPLFILYTSGSTGKPKGMLHTTAGYMVYAAYTFNNIFRCQKDDVFWCTADIGWITGHTYLLYGPLLNGVTTVLFEGVPSYPDHSRFWQLIEKHKVSSFYTAPTAIRALAKESLDFVEPYAMQSLKILGSVGEPINEEAWHWYNDHVGKKNCPITDTWWQTETGGILIAPIPFVTPTKPTYATLPLPGVQPVLMDESKQEIERNQVGGNLCIKFPWPGMARSIWGDHERFVQTYFSAYPGYYFTGDGARRDEVGYYRITGRVDDVVIVSGHNLGTAPIEDAINEHPAVAESAIVGFPHPIKGNALFGFILLKESGQERIKENLSKEINQLISDQIGPIAKLDKMQFVLGLPKTRSGKIMRRILRKIAEGEKREFGDISTLLNPEVVEDIVKQCL